MSDFLKHECGIAMIRLLKPLDYYVKKYGNVLYGFNQLYLLMEHGEFLLRGLEIFSNQEEFLRNLIF